MRVNIPDGWEKRITLGSEGVMDIVLVRYMLDGLGSLEGGVAIAAWCRDGERVRPCVILRSHIPDESSPLMKTVSCEAYRGRPRRHPTWSALCEVARQFDVRTFVSKRKKMLLRHQALVDCGFELDHAEKYRIPEHVDVRFAAAAANDVVAAMLAESQE